MRIFIPVFFLFVLLSPKGFTQGINKSHGYYENSLSMYNSGDMGQALGEINKLLAEDPENTDGLYLRAFIYLNTSRKDKAMSDYTALLKINPRHEGALTNRALLNMEMEKYDLALEDLNTRVEMDKKSWQALFDRGYCKGLKGDNAGAIADFKNVILLNPDYAAAYANLGFSKINALTAGGLIRPAPQQITDACDDLRQAQSMGDTTVVEMLRLYCK